MSKILKSFKENILEIFKHHIGTEIFYQANQKKKRKKMEYIFCLNIFRKSPVLKIQFNSFQFIFYI